MNKKQLTVAWVITLLLSCLLLTTDSYAEFQYYGESQDGFLWGLWHGVKSVITIPANVLFSDINVYNLDNNGFMYNLGFFIPALLLCEITIPLFIIAWIIKIAFFLIVMLIALLRR